MPESQKDRFLSINEKWLDPRFDNVDLSAYPDYGRPSEKPEDDRFAPSPAAPSRSNPLKQFVRKPDEEALRQLADETRDPALIEELEDVRGEREALAFVRSHPTYYKTDSNLEIMQEWLEGKALAFTRQNLARAFKALSAQGKLEVPRGQHRRLTEEELKDVAVAIQADGEEIALIQYIKYSLGRLDERDYESPREFLAQHADLASEACWFVWLNSRPHASDTPELREFVKTQMRGKPFLTVKHLDAIWALFEKHREQKARDAMFSEFQPEPETAETISEGLEQMDDEGVKRLYKSTLQHIAQH
jgi:hypothetical protein